MKFPKRLSKERISLLSVEDKAIYEKEWGQFSKYEQSMQSDVFVPELISEVYTVIPLFSFEDYSLEIENALYLKNAVF